jgi:tripartite-type tricarboxylate transporter receptor subunit TctC
MFTDSGAKPFMDAGRLVALATTGEKRSPTYPGVSTIKETGIPFTASSWLGFAAPANLPKDVSQRLVGAFLQALDAPDVRAALAAMGNDEVVALGPSEFAAKISGEIEKLKRVAEENKIRAD